MSNDSVTMIFSRNVNIITNDGAKVSFPRGIQEVPAELADHPYLKDNGVVPYDSTKVKAIFKKPGMNPTQQLQVQQEAETPEEREARELRELEEEEARAAEAAAAAANKPQEDPAPEAPKPAGKPVPPWKGGKK